MSVSRDRYRYREIASDFSKLIYGQIHVVDCAISEKFRIRSHLKSEPFQHSGKNASLEFSYLRYPHSHQ